MRYSSPELMASGRGVGKDGVRFLSWAAPGSFSSSSENKGNIKWTCALFSFLFLFFFGRGFTSVRR